MNKLEIVDYLKNNEIDVQNANAAFIVADLVYAAYVESGAFYGVSYSPVSCYFFGNSTNFYQLLDKGRVRQLAHKMYEDYLIDSNTVLQRVAEHQKLTDEMDELWNGQRIEHLDNSEFADFYSRFVDCARRWWHFGVIGEDKGAVITERVAPNFQKRHNLSPIETQHIISTLSHPTEQSVLNAERKKFLQLCLYIEKDQSIKDLLREEKFSQILDNKELNQLIEEYLSVGFWMKTDFYDAKIITAQNVLEDVFKHSQEHSEESISDELQKIDRSLEGVKSEQREIRSKFSFSKEDEMDISFSQLTALWIDRRKEGMMKQLYYFMMLVKETAKRFDLSYEEATRYSVDELEQLIRLEKRKDLIPFKSGGFVFYETGKNAQIFYGQDGEELLKIAKHVDMGSQLKGMVASKGNEPLVKGKVRIVHNPQSENFENGDILVTSMTRVEFVPLMRRALAIITNEGGIACHAAIVSRELGIPCIIGTRVATDYLKDGELVEMNLKDGTVTKN